MSCDAGECQRQYHPPRGRQSTGVSAGLLPRWRRAGVQLQGTTPSSPPLSPLPPHALILIPPSLPYHPSSPSPALSPQPSTLSHPESAPPPFSPQPQRPLGGSFHSTPQAVGLAPQFASGAPNALAPLSLNSPHSSKAAFGPSSSSSGGLGAGGGNHSSHGSGGGVNSPYRSQTSSLEALPVSTPIELALREVNQKFRAGEASKPSKEVSRVVFITPCILNHP